QILTLVSIYWHSRSIGTSVRYYHANGLGSSRPRPAPEPVRVPQGLASFPGITGRLKMPRSYVDEWPENVTHWTDYDTGGHFPAIEEPDLLVDDLREFFRPLRSM
ncbi:MAG: epoxide hydrolase, partial [Acidobacteria bacterium]|nr:epoxide hydrolase [Acidobacteriota bacterium]